MITASVETADLHGQWKPEDRARKVVVCTPTIVKPYPQYLKALGDSIPLIVAAGWDEGSVWQVGCPYISAARAMLLRKALDAGATDIVFIDHDLSWQPDALLQLLKADGDVVAGTYRYKHDAVEYMGALLPGLDGTPQTRWDGAVKAHCIPAGFMRITREGVSKFIREYPELLYGEACAPHVDLFNHGAHEGVWYGEDYAFSRRWTAKCGDIWVLPDLNIDHHTTADSYRGNFHEYLLRQPGGSEFKKAA